LFYYDFIIIIIILKIDKAVAIGLVGTSVAELDKIRDRLVARLNELSEKDGVIIPIPSKPLPISSKIVGGAITHMLTTKGDPELVLPPLVGTVKMKGNLDVRDERGNNLTWSVCQAAIMRAVAAAEAAKTAAKAKSPSTSAPKLPAPPVDASLPPTPSDNEDKDKGEEEEEPPNESDIVLPILKVLLENGARAEQRFPSQNNRTPLQMLAMAGAVECAELAIRYGAGVFTYDDSGWTPLLVACSPNGPRSGNNANMVELLIQAGSRVDQQTETGLCPLAAAAQCNDGESVELLLEAGAKLTNRCGMGFSPVIWGLIGGNGIPNAAINALLKSASQNTETKYEVDQDMRCYFFSRLLNSLKVVYNRSIEASNEALKVAADSNGKIKSGVLVDENGKVDPKQHRIAIVSQMTRFVAITSGNGGADFNIHDVSSNPLLKLFLSIEASMPDIFKYQVNINLFYFTYYLFN
jgi:ankyrin repeat protein